MRCFLRVRRLRLPPLCLLEEGGDENAPDIHKMIINNTTPPTIAIAGFDLMSSRIPSDLSSEPLSLDPDDFAPVSSVGFSPVFVGGV